MQYKIRTVFYALAIISLFFTIVDKASAQANYWRLIHNGIEYKAGHAADAAVEWANATPPCDTWDNIEIGTDTPTLKTYRFSEDDGNGGSNFLCGTPGIYLFQCPAAQGGLLPFDEDGCGCSDPDYKPVNLPNQGVVGCSYQPDCPTGSAPFYCQHDQDGTPVLLGSVCVFNPNADPNLAGSNEGCRVDLDPITFTASWDGPCGSPADAGTFETACQTEDEQTNDEICNENPESPECDLEDFCNDYPLHPNCDDDSDEDPNDDSDGDGDPENDDENNEENDEDDNDQADDEDDSLGDDETGDNDSDENDDGIVCTINGQDCTDEIGDVVCTINGEQCEDGNGDPVCIINGQDCLAGGTCASGDDDCAANSGTCEEKPKCQGDPIGCAEIHQTWYARCGGKHSDLGNCEEELKCEGDPLQCAQIRLEHIEYCNTQPTKDERDNPNNLTNYMEGVDDGQNWRGGENVEGSQRDVGDLVGQLDQSGYGVGASCIEDAEWNTTFGTVTIPFSLICPFYDFIRAIVLLIGAFQSVLILFRAF